jgi:hypothetical protein
MEHFASLFMGLDQALRRRCQVHARRLEQVSLACAAEALACPQERLAALLGGDGAPLNALPTPLRVEPEPALATGKRQAPLAAVQRRQLHNALMQGFSIHHMCAALVLAKDAWESVDRGLSVQLELHANLAQWSQFWALDPGPGALLAASGTSSVRWIIGGQGPEARISANACLPHILVQELSKAALELAFSWALPRPGTAQEAWAQDLIARADRLEQEPWHWVQGPELARRLAAQDPCFQSKPLLEACRSFALLPLEAAETRCLSALSPLFEGDSHAKNC